MKNKRGGVGLETLVRTKSGLKATKEVKVGEEILTSFGRFEEVLKVEITEPETAYLISLLNSDRLVCSPNLLFIANDDESRTPSLAKYALRSDSFDSIIHLLDEIEKREDKNSLEVVNTKFLKEIVPNSMAANIIKRESRSTGRGKSNFVKKDLFDGIIYSINKYSRKNIFRTFSADSLLRKINNYETIYIDTGTYIDEEDAFHPEFYYLFGLWLYSNIEGSKEISTNALYMLDIENTEYSKWITTKSRGFNTVATIRNEYFIDKINESSITSILDSIFFSSVQSKRMFLSGIVDSCGEVYTNGDHELFIPQEYHEEVLNIFHSIGERVEYREMRRTSTVKIEIKSGGPLSLRNSVIEGIDKQKIQSSRGFKLSEIKVLEKELPLVVISTKTGSMSMGISNIPYSIGGRIERS